MTDPISDFLTRIKNGFLAHQATISAPYSGIKAAVAEILVKEGYLDKVEVLAEGAKKVIQVTLKYQERTPAITDVRRMSRPGRRMYMAAKRLPKTLGGYGVTIVSTSKGVMTDKQARQAKVGGELICQVW